MEPDPTTGQPLRQARAHKTHAPPDPDALHTSAEARVPIPSGGAPQVMMPAKGRKRKGSSWQVLQSPPVPMLDVEAALKEITLVPAATIHRTAAYAWASRAVASYRVCAGKAAVQEGLSYLYLGEHYREAALAHASMGEAWQPLFAEIDQAMAEERTRAFASMRGRSPVATP